LSALIFSPRSVVYAPDLSHKAAVQYKFIIGLLRPFVKSKLALPAAAKFPGPCLFRGVHFLRLFRPVAVFFFREEGVPFQFV
jgi:hypothetical protein